jgi:isocitrate dehydrogenase kinase/phosphatase
MKDRFGYGTGDSRQRMSSESFFNKYQTNHEDYDNALRNWFNSEPSKDDHSIFRSYLKAVFPGSGLLQVINKETGETKSRATFAGDDKDEFRKYISFMTDMAKTKGLDIPDITATKELEGYNG